MSRRYPRRSTSAAWPEIGRVAHGRVGYLPSMERQSSKHNPRVDDSMKKEAQPLERARNEPRVHESREAEPPADGEPFSVVGRPPSANGTPVPSRLTTDG